MSSSPPPAAALALPERGRVWIVEDSPLEAELARRVLSPAFDVELFEEGGVMLERLSSGLHPDALVLDWHLPGMTGLEICEFVRTRADEISLPVLLVTASQQGNIDVVKGLTAGANDYLRKPYEPAELLARVSTVVRVSQLQRRASALLEGERAARALAEGEIAARRAAEEFEKQLIGIVSHDLRNPLQTIVLSSSLLLKRDELNPASTRVVNRIQATAFLASRMIRDLLDFSQARVAGGIPVEVRECDLHAIVGQAVEELRLVHSTREIVLQQEGDGAAVLDPDRLSQVLNNLVNNAVNYSTPDTPVTVRTLRDGEKLRLEVRNSGNPIPLHFLPLLFKPMQRGAEAGSGDRQGRSVGLGLYIVDQIAKAHHGSIAVSSSSEDGTVFTVGFPLDASHP